jgi:pimeloyl-ACP methyl ester carboxylesterase
MLVLRALSLEPSLARTWAAGGGPIDSGYRWHEAARLWQTPGVGEQVMESLTPEALAGALVAAGVPMQAATDAAAQVDSEMKRCILALYRSAVAVGAEWEPELKRITAPGLLLWGSDDPYVEARFGSRLAQRVGARFVSFAGCSHWWQLERAKEVAAELQSHWSSTRPGDL